MPSEPLCPSSDADQPGARIIGVVGGSTESPRVRQLEHPVPVTAAVLAATAPVDPRRVLRIAAPCIGSGCTHFSGDRCGFGAKVARLLPPVTDQLPACGVRARCRWFAEQGTTVCRRCPQVVTLDVDPSPAMARAADPAVPAHPIDDPTIRHPEEQ